MLTAGVYSTEDTTYLALKIEAPVIQERSRFHLALVLDVSGSMEGERIRAVIRTIHLLIDGMNETDALSIITYNSSATVLANEVYVNESGRAQLHTIIDGLQAEGGTNAEAALFALRQLQNFDAAFLLTDGHVNQGVTSRAGLLRIFSSVVPSGTAVNTLGYGADHNAFLLRDMAVRTCGTYTFADRDELIPAIIGDILGGLANTYAKRAEVVVPDGWECCEIGNSIGMLISEKPQWMLFKRRRGGSLPTAIQVLFVRNSEQERVSLNDYSAHSEIEVAVQRDRCLVAKTLSEASEYIEQGNTQRACEHLQNAQNALETSIARDEPLVISMRANIDDMLTRIPATTTQRPILVGLHRVPANAAILSRMISDSTALGNQRGFYQVSQVTETLSDPIPLTATFSSPVQRTTSQTVTSRYSQIE